MPDVNPYYPTAPIDDGGEPALPATPPSDPRRRQIVLGMLRLFRFGAMGFITLIMLIYGSGTGVNWPNVLPVFAALSVGMLGTHVAQLWMPLGRQSIRTACFPYLLGALATVIFFALDRGLNLFNGFTR